MSIDQIYRFLLWFLFGFSVLTFIGSFFYTTPYGRFKKASEKRVINSLPGWLIMEFPCLAAGISTFFLSGGNTLALVPLVFISIWECHYIYRSIIFPLRMNSRNKTMPLSAVAFGFFFNILTGFLNGYAFAHSEHLLDHHWLLSVNFIVGIALMIIGVSINIQSDSILQKLRQPCETGYKIPHGGLYRWISVPNYFGEIIEWTGLTIAAATPAALAFLVFTIANLLPRAIAHHRWYRKTFPDYPKERKAIIPWFI